MITYVRKDRCIYDFSTCLLCGDAYGICAGQSKAHQATTCLACGTPQCWTTGLARGQCAICYIGLLSAFSARQCGYKGCESQAVAAAPRVGYACAYHLKPAQHDCIAKALMDREKHWERLEVDLNAFPKLGEKQTA